MSAITVKHTFLTDKHQNIHELIQLNDSRRSASGRESVFQIIK
jgi:hypothetical protein